MKIRTGFVSNSSTSSFLIYGVSIESSKLKELLNEKARDSGAVDEEEEEQDEEEENYEDSLRERLEEICDKLGFEFHCPYGDDWYIGRSWSEVGDDQTGAQFKREVEKIMQDILGEDMDCETYSEAWRNG